MLEAFLNPIAEAGVARYWLFIGILIACVILYLVYHYVRAHQRRKRTTRYLVLYLEKNPGEANTLQDFSRACRRMRNNFETAVGRKDTVPLSTIEDIFRDAHKLMQEEESAEDMKGSKC